MDKIEKKKVAAYCRVSTDEEIQKSSLLIQTDFFKQMIAGRNDWELVDVYSDAGETGLNINRPGFQKMLEDVKNGSIDIIMVKSISRLSRNTVDLLKFVRELKAGGVYIYFCKENVNTADSTSELLLTIYGAFAQEESRSISENLKRGARQRFSLGRPNAVRAYGFKRVSKGKWVVDEETAPIIREIYNKIIEGYGLISIAADLNDRGIPTESGNSTGWRACNIQRMVTNVRYKGDALMQKTYVKDFLTGTVADNKDAKVPQYYKKGCYEAIVPEETFDLALRILQLRSKVKGSPQVPYYGLLRCPFCGEPMVRTRSVQNGGDAIWICPGKGDALLQKDRSQCPQFVIRSSYLDPVVKEAINELESSDNPDVAWAQRVTKEQGDIEHGVLYRLVESIVFQDRWTVEITWKNGKKSLKKIERYKQPFHIPMAEVTQNGDNYDCCGYALDKMHAQITAEAIANQADYVGNTEIRFDPETGLPLVQGVRERKKRSGK